MTGARLVVALPGKHKDPAYLAEIIQAERITTLHFVPSMLQVLLTSGSLGPGCRRVRRVFCSGEALPLRLATAFYVQFPATELHNLYGPTDAADDVTAWACERQPGRTTVPMGRPIANTRIYLLDTLGEPVPVGVNGQLMIGGVQVARGYWNKPELTEERFVHAPFRTGGRLYRIGDLGAMAAWRSRRLYRPATTFRSRSAASVSSWGRLKLACWSIRQYATRWSRHTAMKRKSAW